MTKEYFEKVKWAFANDMFDGLTVNELLLEPDKHGLAFAALLYVLDGVKIRGNAIKTNTALADVREAMPGWIREKVDHKDKLGGMIGRIME